MGSVKSASEEIVETLAKHLETQLGSQIVRVVRDWPDPNETLEYPTISILQKNPEFFPLSAYELEKDAVPEDALKANVRYVYGSYEWPMQLDIWAGSKAERNRLYEEFQKAFNTQLPVHGLSLRLEGYYNTTCRYDLSDYNFNDDEQVSQRREWRATMTILAHCKAILEKEEFLIKTGEVTFDTFNQDSETIEVD